MGRKKKGPKAREWIGDWTVTYEWEWNGKLLTSRCQDFKIAEEHSRRASTWFMFNRHVVNNGNGAVWVDGFDPNGGFVSYRPEQIVAIRPHKEVKKKDANEPAQPQNRPRKTRRAAKKS